MEEKRKREKTRIAILESRIDINITKHAFVAC